MISSTSIYIIGPQYPNGEAGHTLGVVSYNAAENLYALCNPAIATPGLQLITAEHLRSTSGIPITSVNCPRNYLLGRPSSSTEIDP